ncbi:MAG: GntR family transcriptional regulator, partial [Phycisphaerae bacterium]
MTKPLTLSKVDEQDPLPKYVQTRDILVAAIRSGRLSPGAKLPSTKEISSLVDVSLITAHKALEVLVEMGLLRREVGRGTFVRDDIDFTGKQPRDLSLGLLLQQSANINVDDYYHSTLINALRREARSDSQRVEFFFHEGFDLRDKRRKDIGAICMHPPIDAIAEVERLAQRVPTVVLGGSYNGVHVTCVDCDNTAGA